MITVGGVGGREGDSSSSGGGDAVMAANTPDLMPDTDRSGKDGIELGDGTSIRGCGVVGRTARSDVLLDHRRAELSDDQIKDNGNI